MDCHNIRKYSLIRKLSNKLITLLCVVCLHLYFCTYLYILLSIYGGCCCYGSNSLFMCYSYARQKELVDSSGKAEAWNLCISAVCIVSTTYGKGGEVCHKVSKSCVLILCTRPHFWKIFPWYFHLKLRLSFFRSLPSFSMRHLNRPSGTFGLCCA